MAAVTKGQEFADLGQMHYSAQAIWFLNGFWETEVEVVELNEDHEIVGSQMMPLSEDAEKVWQVTQKFIELDDRSEKGNELDEFKSHQLLEKFAQALTVIEMREALREIDVDSNGQMSLMEYLVYRYKRGVDETVNAPQGSGDQSAIDHAAKVVEDLQHALQELSAAEEAQRQAQAAVEQAEAECEEAVAELHAQEEAYHGAIARLEGTVADESLGVVKKNRAAAELAQLKAEDPLPLSRAKITQEAALRRLGKEKKKMQEKTAECVARREECQAAMEEAKAELEELKKGGGVAQGNIWWMEREIEEAEKYLPKSKQRQK